MSKEVRDNITTALKSLEEEVKAMRSSLSWRLTAPGREFVSLWLRAKQSIARHRRSIGILECSLTADVLDSHWYAETNQDVRKEPFLHFARHGAFEGRPPHRRFSEEAYLILNPDVAAAGLPASLHYMLHGYRERRLANWLDFYLANQFGNTERIRISSLIDFLLRGEGARGGLQSRAKKLRILTSRLRRAVRALDVVGVKPRVSVIVPVYNQVFYTITCAISLFESRPKHSFELIIADDCSTDETSAVFSSLGGAVKMVRTGGNFGFLRNCNHAARMACGKHVLFLNNDTIVLPGCLDSLVEVLSDERCGAVGAKLLNLDGTLQEAGGVIWRDYEGWNYGRGANPVDPTFNYRRSTDYCSGSCLMVPRVIFEELGGFSTELEVAYGEDSDLCMAIRHRLGRDVIYEPRARLVHFEGQSCGTSVESGVKRYQVVNKEKLARKWAPVTDTFTPASEEHAQSGPRRHMGWPRVCLIDHYVPRFDRESGSRRLMTILQILRARGCHVYFLAENMFAEEPYATEVRKMGVELLVGAPGFSGSPGQLLADRRAVIDLVWCVRPEMTMKWMTFFRGLDPGIKIVFDTGDIHHLRLRAEEMISGRFVPELSPSEDMRRQEEQLCRQADLTVAISRDDAKVLGKMGAERVEVVSGIYSDCTCPDDPSFSEREGLLFVGSAHSPNTDGILWFLEQVWPLVRARCPDLGIDLVGTLDQSVHFAAGEGGVRVSGHVPDLAGRFRRARVFVCPLRFGAGIKGKLGQCIEYGLPFVTTPVGADGMNFTHGKDALICADPGDFAEGIVRLYHEEELWLRIRKNLVQHLATYSTEKAGEGLEGVLSLIPGYKADRQS